jgi:para-nitrobenzyl esterase
MGAGSQRLYEATDLARRGCVVVSVNYRLGPLGFFAHPQLSAESEHGVSGNYGLLDQIEALRWVQRNIASFGGDPNRVTIFGESAGGGSVFSLLVSPLTKGLFHRAIAQSGPALNFAHLKKTHYGFQSAEAAGLEFAKSCGAPEGEGQLAALRAMSADTLLKTAPTMEGGPRTFTMRANMLRLAPVVDGYVLPDDVMTLLAEGRQHPVPLIVGANRDEASIFALMGVMPKGVEELKAALEQNVGVQLAENMFELYPTKTAADVRRTVTDLMGDFLFVAPARYVASSMRHAKAPAFMYHFAHPPAGVTGRSFGAHHGAEVAYILGNLELAGGDVTDTDHEIAGALANYWVQFAATGNPNRDGLTAWPQYDPATDECLLVGDKISVERGLRKARLDAMDQFMEAWRHESGVASRPSSGK